MLNSFVLVDKNQAISPPLVTTREYGNWLETVFDSSICNSELYMKTIKNGGERVLEKHPGTKIGAYYDKTKVDNADFKCWYILEDSKVIDRLVKLKLAEKKDVIPISVNDEQGRRMLRCYTLKQIELYIRTKIDRNFTISDYIGISKQVKIDDMQYIITQKTTSRKRKLF